jgi:hypothetical protein
VQGTIYFAIGEDCDRAKMTELKTGDYAFIPKGATMFGWTPEAAVVQVHGVGPFHIHWRAGKEWRDRLTTLTTRMPRRYSNIAKGSASLRRAAWA